MKHRSALLCLALGAIVHPSTSRAQADSIYRNANAVAGRSALLGLYGNLDKDCAVGVTPEVIVKTPPKHGALIVRGGKVKTKPANRCPNLEVPVQTVLYQGNANYTGPDEIVFEVRSANGKVQLHTVQMTVAKGGLLPQKPKNEPNDI